VRPRALASQLSGLVSTAREASRAYGVPPLRVARTARRLRRTGAWEYREALAQGLLDPACPEEVRRRAVSRHLRREIQTRLNPVSLEPFTEEKVTFNRYCEVAGIPVPALYGTVGRAGGWSAASGRIVTDGDAFAAMVARDLPERFIVKPTFGLLGLGVQAFERRADGTLLDSGGRALDARALHARLVADPEFDLFIVQERLRNHPDVEALVDTPVVQTLRLNTLVCRDGGVRILSAQMKLAIGRGDADNFRSGETGNGLCDVDMATGTLGPLTTVAPGGRGAVRHDALPATGRRVTGWRVPMFEEACGVALAGAPWFMPMRTLGWDVAITPDGPIVIETNNYWGMSYTPLGPEERALFLTA
jgi:hypothetical protein